MTTMKTVPSFRSEDEEREFWATHDATEHVDLSSARPVRFPELRPSARTISLRLPAPLLESLKVLAHKRDVPYQSLMKILLSEGVERAFRQTDGAPPSR